MPEDAVRAIMSRRNPRTGRNYTRDEAERVIAARQIHPSKTAPDHSHPSGWTMQELEAHLRNQHNG